MPHCGRNGSAVLGLRVMSLLPPPALISSVSRVVVGVSVPSLPLSVLPRDSLTLGGSSGGFVPTGKLVHSGGVDALRQLDSLSHSLLLPPGVFRHSIGLAAPLFSPNLEGLNSHSVGLADPLLAFHS